MRCRPLLLLNSLTGSVMLFFHFCIRSRIMPRPRRDFQKCVAVCRNCQSFSHYGIKYGHILHRTNHIMKIESLEAPKTSIQVIERMVALLDALANYTDPVSLK